MRKYIKNLAVGSLLLFGATACADLEVVNLNEPDAERSLATATDVLSLIGGSFNSWFYGNYNYYGPAMATSNAAFQHNAPWANAGMEKYGRLPRIGFINSIADGEYAYMTRNWFYSYRAIAAVADGLRALESADVQADLDPDEISSAQAFGSFVLGMSHASIAAFYKEGFQVDQTTDPLEPQEPMGYQDLMTAAMGYFDDCISQAQGASWALPIEWMQAALTGPELAEVAHSMKARYMVSNARSWAERQALPWGQIIAEVDAGITEDYVPYYDDYGGWSMDILGYGQYPYWGQMAYFVYGMADQSGDFQAWDAVPLASKNHSDSSGDPYLIVTPDLRFAQGTTVDEQRANEGLYFRVNRAGVETGYTWKRPDRGTWRWSWYKHTRGEDYWFDEVFYQAEIRMEEMNLIKAEGLYHQGSLGAAADLINVTRTAAGLNATDASGTNTSCVPKLPDGTCGGLFEMLKWEKRLENTFRGPMGNIWYFDGRGWGDLWKDTFLHLPLPCGEAQVLQILPCQSYGGAGGEDGAPLSNYKWNGEG
jgi:hypothetical protein